MHPLVAGQFINTSIKNTQCTFVDLKGNRFCARKVNISHKTNPLVNLPFIYLFQEKGTCQCSQVIAVKHSQPGASHHISLTVNSKKTTGTQAANQNAATQTRDHWF